MFELTFMSGGGGDNGGIIAGPMFLNKGKLLETFWHLKA